MATTPARSAILGLYRSLLREGSRMQEYNFREYVARTTRERFRANRALAGADAVGEYTRGVDELGVVRRQASIQALYHGDPSIVEVSALPKN